jgi:hypothetical protein
MKKIFGLILVSVAFLLPGCLTTNWHHNRRHFKRVREEIREWHQDFDMLFFGVEPDETER